MYNKVDARFFILFIFRDSNPHGLLIHVLKCLLTMWVLTLRRYLHVKKSRRFTDVLVSNTFPVTFH